MLVTDLDLYLLKESMRPKPEEELSDYEQRVQERADLVEALRRMENAGSEVEDDEDTA